MLKEFIEMREGLLGSDTPLLGEQQASNNWVVHGDHTETGMPLFASDPHLSNGLPTHWLLYNLRFPDGRIVSGAQLAGVPGIGIGRSNNIAWGCTTSRVDSADLWQEKLSEDGTKYNVDGEWRKLDVIQEVIKVKGQSDIALSIRVSHRGPIMPYSLLQTNSGLLFGGETGDMATHHFYSFAWSGMYAGDDSFKVLRTIYEARDLHELFAVLDGELGESYQGLGQNVLFADTSGNIGYRLLMTIPERKDKTPFIGSRVLDGTTTKFDWTGEIIHQRDLPKSLNPKKGYLVTANNRQSPDNAVFDYGSSTNSPGRALRIDEILREATTSGKKLTLSDIGAIQQDVVDVIARKVAPKLIEISASVKQDLNEQQQASLAKISNLLGDWRGSFEETSTAATAYTRWYIQFVRKLFYKQGKDEWQRMAFSDNYHFTDAYQNIVDSVLAKKEKSHYQVICEGAYASYTGKNYCAFSIAMAMVETDEFLSERVSANPDDWVWRNLHVNEYVNLPWSKTPLKGLFHRSVGVPGNDCTPNVSKVNARKNRDNTVIESVASANFKMLIQLAKDPKDDVSLFSIDGGMHGNLFQGNYFDLNKDHLEGRLKPMRWRNEKLKEVATTTLTLKPAKSQQPPNDDTFIEF